MREPTHDQSLPLGTAQSEIYEFPSLDLLTPGNDKTVDVGDSLGVHDTIIDTFAQFGIVVSRGGIHRGPTVTCYEIYPPPGVRMAKFVRLGPEIARATSSDYVNVLAPVPGKETVGIEITNRERQKFGLRELFESDEFQNATGRIPIVLGKDVYGKTIITDLAEMPHMLVAGTTGSGKSVCLNSIIASILYRFTPDDLRFVMIDSKVVEMQIYNTLPHLVVPVVTDRQKAVLALRWVVEEMEWRYLAFAKTGTTDLKSFNARTISRNQHGFEGNPERVTTPDRMPYLVIILDDLADLMQTASTDIENVIARITQKAAAAGIHMIIATQTPRADIVTGVIKANMPCRIAFQVVSGLDSRVVLDENGAEQLLGQGDMLYRPSRTSRMIRAQGVLVADEEIRKIVEHISTQGNPGFENSIYEGIQSSRAANEEEEISAEDEELAEKCIEIMRQEKKASTSLFQRRLRLGYTRANHILDILEQRGYVGPGEGAKPRDILVDLDSMA